MILACPGCGRTAGVIEWATLYDLAPFWPFRWRIRVGSLVKCAGCGLGFGIRRGQTFTQPFGRNGEAHASSEAAPKREPSRVPSGGDEDMPFNRRRR